MSFAHYVASAVIRGWVVTNASTFDRVDSDISSYSGLIRHSVTRVGALNTVMPQFVYKYLRLITAHESSTSFAAGVAPYGRTPRPKTKFIKSIERALGEILETRGRRNDTGSTFEVSLYFPTCRVLARLPGPNLRKIGLGCVAQRPTL